MIKFSVLIVDVVPLTIILPSTIKSPPTIRLLPLSADITKFDSVPPIDILLTTKLSPKLDNVTPPI